MDPRPDAGFPGEPTTIEGVLVREELEGGFWSLEPVAPHPLAGQSIVLGNPAQLDGCPAGARVRVRGHLDEGRMSIFMAGPTMDVESVERLGT